MDRKDLEIVDETPFETEEGDLVLEPSYVDGLRNDTLRLTTGVMDNLWKPSEGGDQINGMGGTRKMPKRTI